jgi:transposase InsO family protein
LLLQPHTGRRPIRAHEGTVVAPASNQRWASDGLEVPCWSGEVVRVAFAIDTHVCKPGMPSRRQREAHGGSAVGRRIQRPLAGLITRGGEDGA